MKCFFVLSFVVLCASCASTRHHPDITPASSSADLRVETLAGGVVDLNKVNARPMLINFWATWCAPCLHELAMFENVYRGLGPENLDIVAVAVRDDESVVKEFLASKRYSYHFAMDPAEVLMKHFRIEGLPVTLVIDEGGRVKSLRDPASGELVKQVVGPRDWDSPAGIDAIKEATEE